MTEDQRKQYEEAASNYSPYGSLDSIGTSTRELFETRKRHFIAGCKHAHSKIEEAERAILSDVFTIIENHQTLSMDDAEYKALETVKEELKRLRK